MKIIIELQYQISYWANIDNLNNYMLILIYNYNLRLTPNSKAGINHQAVQLKVEPVPIHTQVALRCQIEVQNLSAIIGHAIFIYLSREFKASGFFHDSWFEAQVRVDPKLCTSALAKQIADIEGIHYSTADAEDSGKAVPSGGCKGIGCVCKTASQGMKMWGHMVLIFCAGSEKIRVRTKTGPPNIINGGEFYMGFRKFKDD